MYQQISRALCRGQNYLSQSSIHRTTVTPSSNLPTCRFASWSQSSRSLTTAAAATKPARSYTPMSHAPTPPPTKSPEELAGASYIVRRTPSIQLPVYRRFASGGNRQVVLIKKVDGDRKKLLDDLVETLGVSKQDIRLNPTTQHIELKGDYYEKTKSWLLERGF
ncbi:mitochondrial large ribosomal subunit L49 [Metarhizium anisopliae]